MLSLTLSLLPYENAWASVKELMPEEETGSVYHTGYRPSNPDLQSEATALAKETTKLSKRFSLSFPEYKKGTTVELTLWDIPMREIWPKELIPSQGALSSCTANAMQTCIRYLSLSKSDKKGPLLTNPDRLDISRLYQYWNTRWYESKLYKDPSIVLGDNGASMAGAIIALDKYGACPETTVSIGEKVKLPDLKGSFTYDGWPYVVKKYQTQPDPESYRLAHDESSSGLSECKLFDVDETAKKNPYAVISDHLFYKDLTTLYRHPLSKAENTTAEKGEFTQKVISSLQSGNPFYVGIMLDDTFMKDQRGFIPTPPVKTFRATGGHAITVVGYGPYNPNDRKINYFKFMNSWGPDWGDHGFGYLEESYLANVNPYSIEGFGIGLNPLSKTKL